MEQLDSGERIPETATTTSSPTLRKCVDRQR